MRSHVICRQKNELSAKTKKQHKREKKVVFRRYVREPPAATRTFYAAKYLCFVSSFPLCRWLFTSALSLWVDIFISKERVYYHYSLRRVQKWTRVSNPLTRGEDVTTNNDVWYRFSSRKESTYRANLNPKQKSIWPTEDIFPVDFSPRDALGIS